MNIGFIADKNVKKNQKNKKENQKSMEKNPSKICAHLMI